MSDGDKKLRVLRVTQLDTEQYDDYAYNMLKTFLLNSFKDQPFTFLLNFEPEISACLRYVLWRFSTKLYNRNIAQEMLGTEYMNKNERPMTELQRNIFGVYIVLLKWLKDRQNTFLRLLQKFQIFKEENNNRINIVRKILSTLEIAIQLFTLLNFLKFLSSGDHVTLFERAFEISHVYTAKPAPRYIDYAYRRKELIWENIQKTIICVLPFINFRKIANTLHKTYSKIFTSKLASLNTDIDFNCAICHQLATNPYCGVCDHVYCYYCIQTSLMMTDSLDCVKCNLPIDSIKPVECSVKS